MRGRNPKRVDIEREDRGRERERRMGEKRGETERKRVVVRV